jgi:hemerythrin-like domain-containing protein
VPAERLAATGAPATGETRGCDTADVLMIHRFIRGMFRDAVVLVARVPDGDRRATRLVARHLTRIAHVLHGHHHGEDVFLWDDLETRAPACAVHVGQMRAQHAEITELLDDLATALAAWRMTADAAHAADVGAALARLNTTLDRHLGQEEDRILPAAAASFTQREWDRLAEHGRRTIPPGWAFPQLGFMLDSMPEAEASAFLAALPAPLRALWSLVGQGVYRRTRARLYGSLPGPEPLT